MDQATLSTARRRTTEMAAIFMVGDGLIGLLQPERHVALWRSRAPALDWVIRPFAGRPGARRLYGLVQIGCGLALAARQHRD